MYPKFYHYTKSASDRDWILSRMRVIPDKYKQRVSIRYEQLYKCNRVNRRVANTYLNRVARWFN